MPYPEEKRILQRTCRRIPVMFADAMENPFCYYGAFIVNYSQIGLHLESEYPVPPGVVIIVRFVEQALPAVGAEISAVRLLDVLWSHAIPNQGQEIFHFGGRLLPKGLKDPAVMPARSLDQDPVEANWYRIVDRLDSFDSESAAALKALEKARELSEARSRHLSVLNRFAGIITSTLDFNRILQTICREMVAIFKSRNAGIGLLDRQGTALKIVAFHSADPAETDATGIVIPVEDNEATRFVIQTRQSLIVADAQHSTLTASYHHLAAERGTRCLMIVPLMSSEKVIGTIGLPATRDKPKFTPEEVLLAQTIAAQISGAIENARLYKETLVAKNLAEKELEIGRRIQAGFLPGSLPVFAGWEFQAHFSPARQVSGDFYDVIPLVGTGKVGVVLGDVCDKGVGAALFMALFRSLIRSTLTRSTRQGLHPGRDRGALDDEALLLETAVSVNDYIATEHDSSNMFATVFLGLLELDTGRLAYVNGGHEPPLICRSDGVRVRLHPTGPALGLLPGIALAVARERLAPGEVLAAFTDGVIEARNEEGHFYTRERLVSLITGALTSEAGLIHDILLDVRAHIGDMDPYDDLTLLTVRRFADHSRREP